MLQYVQNEFEAHLKCGRLEHGFLRVQCESCHNEQLVALNKIQLIDEIQSTETLISLQNPIMCSVVP
ncbi:MAG: hypothetical protein BGO44_04370 [Legionella sp. 39-23]|nr:MULTISPECIES: transposase zinc-binding domain-containing protein [Legionella]OJW09518.1 MAG: hypothetical protein BGO44_04370 [Legionella sp. 39-23]